MSITMHGSENVKSVCVCIYICMCVYVCMYVCICIYIFMYVCMYVCVYVHVCMCMYVCVYIYIHVQRLAFGTGKKLTHYPIQISGANFP